MSFREEKIKGMIPELQAAYLVALTGAFNSLLVGDKENIGSKLNTFKDHLLKIKKNSPSFDNLRENLGHFESSIESIIERLSNIRSLEPAVGYGTIEPKEFENIRSKYLLNYRILYSFGLQETARIMQPILEKRIW
jgi:hypothetical protein